MKTNGSLSHVWHSTRFDFDSILWRQSSLFLINHIIKVAAPVPGIYNCQLCWAWACVKIANPEAVHLWTKWQRDQKFTLPHLRKRTTSIWRQLNLHKNYSKKIAWNALCCLSFTIIPFADPCPWNCNAYGNSSHELVTFVTVRSAAEL